MSHEGGRDGYSRPCTEDRAGYSNHDDRDATDRKPGGGALAACPAGRYGREASARAVRSRWAAEDGPAVGAAMRQPRKPDAFEKMVQKAVHGDAVLTQIEAVQLLRAYHGQVVRLVTRQWPTVRDRDDDIYDEACKYLLTALAKLKNGTQP